MEDFESIWEGQSGAPRTRAQLEGERQSELADLCPEQGGSTYVLLGLARGFWSALGVSCSSQRLVHSHCLRGSCALLGARYAF